MRIVTILTLLFTITSCEKCKERNDDELCSIRVPNSSDNLLIHGFYFKQNEINSNITYEVICLFRNGVLLDLHTLSESEWNNLDGYLIENNYLIDGNRDKLDWGIYDIADSSISIEKWYPSNDFFPVYRHVGKILSDSTFQLTESSRCDCSERRIENDIYQFRHSLSRPDSTNIYTN